MRIRVIVTIILSQFACTSVWFAANAVIPELAETWNIPIDSIGIFTSATQFGFILGTLALALLGIADKFPPSKVFFICGLLAATSNWALLLPQLNIYSITFFRGITGIALAGVYPIGIKLASDYYQNGLGRALGFLVGMLVLGTAIPHFFNYISLEDSLKDVIQLTSGLAAFGAILVGFTVPKGPYHIVSNQKFDLSKIKIAFKNINFKKAAFGYFGHMWELYTFWAFVPVLIKLYNQTNNTDLSISFWSFIIIGIGALSCIYGGFLALKYSSQWVAKYSLSISMICCLLCPFAFFAPSIIFIAFLLIWGMMVIADSPQFSTLVAQSAPAAVKGTAITLVNCIGYALTIVSIQLTEYSIHLYNYWGFLLLSIGPILGFLYFQKKLN